MPRGASAPGSHSPTSPRSCLALSPTQGATIVFVREATGDSIADPSGVHLTPRSGEPVCAVYARRMRVAGFLVIGVVFSVPSVAFLAIACWDLVSGSHDIGTFVVILFWGLATVVFVASVAGNARQLVSPRPTLQLDGEGLENAVTDVPLLARVVFEAAVARFVGRLLEENPFDSIHR